MNVDIFGYFAALLTTAAFLPQLIKTLKTKKADDVSLTTLIMFIIGVLSWIIYGYKISSTPCLLYTSPSPRDMRRSRMPSSA